MEGKNGFILYKDIIHTVKKLPIEKRGELFTLILEYVNDLNPDTSSLDIGIDIVFTQIQSSLKRDLKKWESRTEKKSQSGQLGNLKRWHPELYKRVEDDEISIEQALQETKNHKPPVKAEPKPVDNRSFLTDVNRDGVKDYRLVIYKAIEEKKISRDSLFMKAKLNLSRRNEIWEDFIENCKQNTPRFEDDKHIWNTFKKFIDMNKSMYQGQTKTVDRNPQ